MPKVRKVDNSSYTYEWISVEDNSRKESLTLVAGKDGVSQEIINYLIEEDEKLRKMFDRDVEETDTYFENRRGMYEKGYSDFKDDPFEQIPEALISRTLESIDVELEERLREFLENDMSPEQCELMYLMHGSCLKKVDIARMEGVSKQAINQRKNRAYAKIEKELMK